MLVPCCHLGCSLPRALLSSQSHLFVLCSFNSLTSATPWVPQVPPPSPCLCPSFSPTLWVLHMHSTEHSRSQSVPGQGAVRMGVSPVPPRAQWCLLVPGHTAVPSITGIAALACNSSLGHRAGLCECTNMYMHASESVYRYECVPK